MSLDEWWPRLKPETRDWLVANNGDVVPSDVRDEILAVSGPITADAWWVEEDRPDGLQLSDTAVDWVEAYANCETPTD